MMTKIDPYKVFLQAQRFHFAEQTIIRSQPAMSSDKAVVLAMPMLVLSAFSIELYLNTLLLITTGKYEATHNLKALYNKLPQHCRKTIKEKWRDHQSQPAMAQLHVMLKNTDPFYDTGIEYVLEQSKSAFVKLRYIYNNNDASYLAHGLAPILQDLIFDLKPDWRHHTIQPTPPVH